MSEKIATREAYGKALVELGAANEQVVVLDADVAAQIIAEMAPDDAADVLDELIDRYGDPPPSVSDLVNVSLVRVQATAVGVYEVTQKKDTLVLQVEQLDLRMIQGLLVAFNGRVVTGAGAKPYLSVTLQKEEKPLELLQSILRAMQDILKD